MSSAMPFFRSLSRSGAAAVATLALLVGPVAAAQAHVHVHPDSTAAGSDAELAFKVPSESPKASTTTLSITLPQDHPFLKVAAQVTPGWTVKVVTDPLPTPVLLEGTTLTEAVHTVTWTAKSGEGIPPQQYQNFYLSVGPLPASGDLVFAAKQTYSDGSVVTWDQPATAGADEPEHPAPSFSVTPALNDAATDADAAAEEPAAETSSTDRFSRWLGGAGLLAGLGAIGLLVARRSPRPSPSPSPSPSSSSSSSRTPDDTKTPNDETTSDDVKTLDDDTTLDDVTTLDGEKSLDLSTAGTGRPSA